MDDQRLAQLEEEIFAAQRRVNERERLQRRHQRMSQALSSAQAKAEEARKALAKETADLIAAQEGSVGGAVRQALAGEGFDVDKERKERVAAMLRYQQATKSAESMATIVKKLEDEIDALKAYVERRDFLTNEKEQLLADQDTGARPRAVAVFEHGQRAVALNNGVGGARFAIQVGRDALSALDLLTDRLAHAGRTDLWDLDRDGVITQDEKYAVIQGVSDACNQAQVACHDRLGGGNCDDNIIFQFKPLLVNELIVIINLLRQFQVTIF